MSILKTNWDDHEFTSTGHSRRIRTLLWREREALRATRPEVAAAIASYMTARSRALDDEPVTFSPVHRNSLYSWERFKRHPNLPTMSAWAEVLGMRLRVVLTRIRQGNPVMLVTEEAAEIARTVDEWDDELLRIVLNQVREIQAAREKRR